MEPFQFAGEYEDAIGIESVVWLATTARDPGIPRVELQTSIREIEFSGHDFDGLDPIDADAAIAAGFTLDRGGLHECVLRGDLPCHVLEAGVRRNQVVRFQLDLRAAALKNRAAPKNLTLSLTAGDQRYAVEDDWFEDGLAKLQRALPDGTDLVCCFTCLLSDYSPGGHGLWGIRCHRDAKAQYLAVRSKTDYWSVPVTEEVPETYVCPEYQQRVPGTGYRG